MESEKNIRCGKQMMENILSQPFEGPLTMEETEFVQWIIFNLHAGAEVIERCIHQENERVWIERFLDIHEAICYAEGMFQEVLDDDA